MKIPFAFLLATLFILPLLSQAAEGPAARQDLAALRTVAQQFLRTQASGLPGSVEAEVDALDPRLNLTACTTPQAFLPNGSRAWGKTTVGLRCSAPAPWTVYVAARIRIMAEYVAAAAPLAQGQLIGADDIAMLKGDLSALPAGILTDSSQAIGRTMTRSLPLGTPLREDSIRRPQAIRMGQTVQLVSVGPGFRISGEGRAISNANEGQTAQARTPAGQIVSGIAAAGGVLEVRY
jgi:flagellar basal body P-ring formation protein FlgA